MARTRRYGPVSIVLLVCSLAGARPGYPGAECGSTRESLRESLFRHRRSVRLRGAAARVSPAASSDFGEIAVMPAVDGILEQQNQFNLNGASLSFLPADAAATQYRYVVAQQGYDSAAAAAGAPEVALDDDDSRTVALPFAFPFYGGSYRQVYLNSDGNLTFTMGDNASSLRSLGRMTAGPPRISPLFDDLNPAQTAGGVRVLAEAARVVVSWIKVPEYSQSGSGVPQTFQVSLFPDGRIVFAYSSVNPSGAVVGIAPGNLQPGTTLVDFLTDASAAYQAAVAEVFGNTLTLDVVTVAQQFYQTHEDAYDYLVIYNSMGIPALTEGTVAYEETVRSAGSGYGTLPADDGREFGSPGRLQAVLNLGPLSQYPVDPNGLVPARAPQADTPLTILTHEAGHLFLAYASVRGAQDPSSLPMLGFQMAHWSFLFDSEASVMEGERIADGGSATRPEFLTTDITQGYSPLDQYLMGFRDAAEVPDVFLVTNPSPNYLATQHQYSGVAFDGTRQNISVSDLIAAEGRRTPDATVAQRRFRFAFILVVAAGAQPAAADLARVDGYRQQFAAFYAKASSGRAAVETTLRRSLKLSLFPAGGVVAGQSARASLSLQAPAVEDLRVQLTASSDAVTLPASVTIPAGSSSATFMVQGGVAGVADLTATAADAAYEAAFARVQVASAAQLRLVQVPGSASVRLTDDNNLPYRGAGIVATPSPDGSVVPAEAYTDDAGVASFQWNPGPAPINSLTLAVDGQPAANLTLHAGSAVPAITSVVNAASLAPALAPGTLALLTGSHLTGAALKLGSAALAPLSVQDSQIQFVVPADTALGDATLSVTTAGGLQAVATISIVPAAPGIFAGGIAQSQDFLEIYCTGLGNTGTAPLVFIGATPAQPVFYGPAPGLAGIQQVNVQIPATVARGQQPVVLSIASVPSNSINVVVQ